VTAPFTSSPPTTVGPRVFAWGARTFVMGIVNVTPDSFSGDGILTAADVPGAAVAQAQRMVAEGADLLDVGGESTRPGHADVAVEEERDRVIPVVAAIRAALPNIPISIDTTKPHVAEAALAAGANLVNDIWGVGPSGADIAAVAASGGVPLIVMHNRTEPVYDHVTAEVVADLEAALERAIRIGVPEVHLIIDPGIGFGKTADHNVTLLHDLAELRRLGRPVLLGTSRKSTIGRILDLPPEERLEGTLATTALGIASGVDIVRVHDVLANVRVARVADAIVRGHWRAEPPEGGNP
jgi:dihydropteroate synthase